MAKSTSCQLDVSLHGCRLTHAASEAEAEAKAKRLYRLQGSKDMRRSRELPRLGKQEALGDAISRIFSERASFELREDDVEALRKQLRNGSLAHTAAQQTSNQAQREAEDLSAWKAKHPCLLSNLARFLALAKGKRVTVFMDYDGTLTPIVKDPDRAFMSDQMRDAVRAVARLFPTAIISGRGREKVQGFVKLKELFYAGSHGMDIVGPKLAESGGDVLSFQAAAKFEPVMDRVFDDLVERTKAIPGAYVEHNKFCVSVHFRNCEPDRLEEVVAAVEVVLASDKDLKATRGRKVLEIRPQVEWNKGHALAHLLSSLHLGNMADVVPIYIGDDRTDEDAFAVLNQRENGVGILVSTKVKPTEAVYTLRDPVEVMSFLTHLVAWGRTEDNAWHRATRCSGWRLDPNVAPLEMAAAPLRGDSGAYSSEMSDTGDDEVGITRKGSGRPPRCPPDRSRLSHIPQHQSRDACLPGGQSDPLKPHRPSQDRSEVLPSGAWSNGSSAASQPPPASPFERAPLWSGNSAAYKGDPVPSSQAAPEAATQPGPTAGNGQSSERKSEESESLESMIKEVADTIREANQANGEAAISQHVTSRRPPAATQ